MHFVSIIIYITSMNLFVLIDGDRVLIVLLLIAVHCNTQGISLLLYCYFFGTSHRVLTSACLSYQSVCVSTGILVLQNTRRPGL